MAERKAAGLTQAQMAEQLGVGQSYVSKIERGESYIDILTFVDWCFACGQSPGQALDQVLAVIPSRDQGLVKPTKKPTTAEAGWVSEVKDKSAD